LTAKEYEGIKEQKSKSKSNKKTHLKTIS